jgi:hypothetical protein
MKKATFTIAVLLMSAGLFIACLSSEQKKEAADAQVVIAVDNLNDVQKNADVAAAKVATAQELKTFKLESDLKIKTNEVRIAELKLKMNKSGSTQDQVYERSIDSLEMKNLNLKTRMGNYERNHSDWTKFKRDFNRDLDELGTKLKKIASENLK